VVLKLGAPQPQYKGISVNGRNYFRFVGYTKGYSTFHVSSRLYNDLLSIANIENLSERRCLDGCGNPNLRMLRVIARRLNLNEENLVRSGYRRAVFIAVLAHNTREFLLGQDDSLDYFDHSFEDIANAWKEKWLWRRCAKSHVTERVNKFTPLILSLKKELECGRDIALAFTQVNLDYPLHITSECAIRLEPKVYRYRCSSVQASQKQRQVCRLSSILERGCLPKVWSVNCSVGRMFLHWTSENIARLTQAFRLTEFPESG